MRKLLLFIAISLLAIPRLNAQSFNTQLDTSFKFCGQMTAFLPAFTNFPRPNVNTYANKVLVLPDDKIMVAGPFRATINGEFRYSLFRLNSDGLYDSSFNFFGNPVAQWQTATKVVQLADGKFLVAGSFSQDAGTMQIYKGLYRINADGSEDKTFNSSLIDGVVTNNKPCIYDFEVFPNGNILIAGDFITYAGDSVFNLAVLNADGTLNSGFTSPYKAIGPTNIYDVLITPNQKIMVGASASFSFLILNTSGGIDTASMMNFRISSAEPKMELLPDGKILFAGNIGGIPNLPPGYEMARLNPDFTLDASFNVVTGLDKVINNIVVLPDGKLLIVGDFITVNGVSSRKMARLNADGTLDTTFNLGPDAFTSGGMIYDAGFQSDGKIIVRHSVGRHQNNILQNGNVPCMVNRLNGEPFTQNPSTPAPPSGLTATPTNSIRLNWTDNSNNEDGFYIESSTNANGPWQLIDSVDRDTTTYIHTGLSVGVEYFYRVSAYNGFGSSSFSNIASAVEGSNSILKERLAKGTIYPNPAKDGFWIDQILPQSVVSITNLTGVEVLRKSLGEETTLKVTTLAAGLYTCKVYHESAGVVVLKVLVQ